MRRKVLQGISSIHYFPASCVAFPVGFELLRFLSLVIVMSYSSIVQWLLMRHVNQLEPEKG